MAEKSKAVLFLNEVHRNITSGTGAINALLSKTQDDTLSKDLQTQLHRLRVMEAETARRFKTLGATPKDPSKIQQLGMRMGIEMNTALNKSSSHLAELMIKGNNMGIIDLNRAMNRYGTSNAEVYELADSLLKLEQNALDTFKTYL